MRKRTSIIRGLKIGDLVYHALYGRKWVGILIDIIDVYEEDNALSNHAEFAIIQMQPNTKYEHFFKQMVSQKNKLTDSCGLVSMSWIFKLEERK